MYIQNTNIDLLVIFMKVNPSKCINVESAVKLNTKKSSFYMNTHTDTFRPLVCRVTDDALKALLKAMPAIRYVGPLTL